MKGIVLAGGTGTRLWPITRSVSKQLLPIYDKPMIYYPISTLMLAGIREILIITTPHDKPHFQALLGDGSELGVRFKFAIQPEPKGLAEAFIIGEDFLSGESCLMILGDNIFHGTGLGRFISTVIPSSGAHIFTYEVANPSQYGVLELDDQMQPKSISEKPQQFISNLAVTGLYFFDGDVVSISKAVKPSPRNELEITSVIEHYLVNGALTYTNLGRGTAWLDTGTNQSMHDASSYVRIIEERTGQKIACLEEIAWRNKWITDPELEILANRLGSSPYANYLRILRN